MSITINNPNIKEAVQLWSFTQDVSLVKKTKSSSLSRSGLRKIISEVASMPIDFNSRPNKEVIRVAQFIANIEPSYKNSAGETVELLHLRTNMNLTEDDIEFVCEKLEGVVKPYIMVSATESSRTNRFVVKSSISKKKIIHRAIRHLLVGSEVVNDPMVYNQVKAQSILMDNVKESYAFLIGMALSLSYNSVPEMMDDFCIQFIDQTENINRTGQAVFYDGTLRFENL